MSSFQCCVVKAVVTAWSNFQLVSYCLEWGGGRLRRCLVDVTAFCELAFSGAVGWRSRRRQEVKMFQQAAANFRQWRLCVLRILIVSLNSPFPNGGKKIFRQAKTWGWSVSFPLPCHWRHYISALQDLSRTVADLWPVVCSSYFLSTSVCVYMCVCMLYCISVCLSIVCSLRYCSALRD